MIFRYMHKIKKRYFKFLNIYKWSDPAIIKISDKSIHSADNYVINI